MNQYDTFNEQKAIDFLEGKRSAVDDKASQLKLIFLSLIYSNFDTLLYSTDNLYSRDTLQDLSGGIAFVVEELNPEVEQDGLIRDELEKAIKQRLQIAGIHILGDDEYNDSRRCPLLILHPHVLKVQLNSRETGAFYIWNTCIKFRQTGFLIVPADSRFQMTTWEISRLGYTPFLSDIRESIDDMVGQFVEAFLFVNSTK